MIILMAFIRKISSHSVPTLINVVTNQFITESVRDLYRTKCLIQEQFTPFPNVIQKASLIIQIC